uniref:B30.2/SPRY domain-containing protein n=1 Tax=Schistocephalus solidus TaxID=70667 RepID=A0A183SYA9_SCHSO
LSQSHLPQHGLDAEDFGPLQDFRVRDPVLSSQLQYSVEAAEVEVIQLPGLIRVDGPGLRSVKECHQDDGIVHLHFGVQMVGIGTENVDLHRYPNRFVSALGMDSQSWGLSYRGETRHNREVRGIHGGKFGRGDLVGCLLNLWHGSLGFFVNRKPIWGTQSWHVLFVYYSFSRIPLGEYYPMVSSTAARSGFRLVFAKSYAISLQLLTCLSLQGAVTTPSVIFDLPGFPPGLQVSLIVPASMTPLVRPMQQPRTSAGQLEKVDSAEVSKTTATADCLDRLSSLLSRSPRIPPLHSLPSATSGSVEGHPGSSTPVGDTTGSLSNSASQDASLPELSAWRVLDNLLKMASAEAARCLPPSPSSSRTLRRRGLEGEAGQEESSHANPTKSLRLDGLTSERQPQQHQPESPASVDIVFTESENKSL